MATHAQRIERIARLVEKPSVSSAVPELGHSNLPVIHALAELLEDAGFTVEVLPLPAAPGKANLLATLGKGSGGLVLAGHTDTVGPNAKNRKLSFDRALAIGSYLRKKRLAIPIPVAGFGEEVLKGKTADNTDERANRRADYVLGPAAGSPPFKGPYLKVKADWKQLK